MEVTSFDQWLDTLADALNKAHHMGMSDEKITESAKQLGDFLASKIQPDVPENRLLKEMWESGNDQEQKALASMIVKLVENKKLH